MTEPARDSPARVTSAPHRLAAGAVYGVYAYVMFLTLGLIGARRHGRFRACERRRGRGAHAVPGSAAVCRHAPGGEVARSGSRRASASSSRITRAIWMGSCSRPRCRRDSGSSSSARWSGCRWRERSCGGSGTSSSSGSIAIAAAWMRGACCARPRAATRSCSFRKAPSAQSRGWGSFTRGRSPWRRGPGVRWCRRSFGARGARCRRRKGGPIRAGIEIEFLEPIVAQATAPDAAAVELRERARSAILDELKEPDLVTGAAAAALKSESAVAGAASCDAGVTCFVGTGRPLRRARARSGRASRPSRIPSARRTHCRRRPRLLAGAGALLTNELALRAWKARTAAT